MSTIRQQVALSGKGGAKAPPAPDDELDALAMAEAEKEAAAALASKDPKRIRKALRMLRALEE